MELSNRLRQYIDEAIRFWEPRRILYNLLLTAVTVFWFALGWSHFRPGVNLQLLLALVVLAALANVCYCAAYLVDIPLQYSSFRAIWRRRRWLLWVAGVLLAMLLASYWINDEIWPGIGPHTSCAPALLTTYDQRPTTNAVRTTNDGLVTFVLDPPLLSLGSEPHSV